MAAEYDPARIQREKEQAWNNAMDEAGHTAEAAALGAIGGGLVGQVGIGAGVGVAVSEAAKAAGEASVDTAGPALEAKIMAEAVEMKRENPDMSAAEALKTARERNT